MRKIMKTKEEVNNIINESVINKTDSIVSNDNASTTIVKQQSSVSIKRGSKGEIVSEIKVYADTIEEAAILAVEQWKKLEKELE